MGWEESWGSQDREGRTASAACQYIPAVFVHDSLRESNAKDCTAGKERWCFYWDLLCHFSCILELPDISSRAGLVKHALLELFT